ncbi:MAG: Rrf2 family transcriptional regulator, partial [Ramlibacter sp.]|nr:Rrf2 family transcriptional regulator [Ramlibacter sp.]
MRLTTFTDYSLRVLVYLAAQPGQRATIARIASAYGISENTLVEVVHNLGRQGWLRNLRGKGGGLELALPPDRRAQLDWPAHAHRRPPGRTGVAVAGRARAGAHPVGLGLGHCQCGLPARRGRRTGHPVRARGQPAQLLFHRPAGGACGGHVRSAHGATGPAGGSALGRRAAGAGRGALRAVRDGRPRHPHVHQQRRAGRAGGAPFPARDGSARPGAGAAGSRPAAPARRAAGYRRCRRRAGASRALAAVAALDDAARAAGVGAASRLRVDPGAPGAARGRGGGLDRLLAGRPRLDG